MTLAQAFARNFLGHAPDWYKLTIVGFLVVNPLVMFFGGAHGPVIAGWLLLLEFIFTLAMALKCYPLQPGGLLAIEGVLIGLTTPASVYEETLDRVARHPAADLHGRGHLLPRELLLFTFTKILLGIRSQLALALMVCLTSAVLSAFLDALTVRRRADHGRRGLLPGVPSLRVRQALTTSSTTSVTTRTCTSCIARISMRSARSCAA